MAFCGCVRRNEKKATQKLWNSPILDSKKEEEKKKSLRYVTTNVQSNDDLSKSNTRWRKMRRIFSDLFGWESLDFFGTLNRSPTLQPRSSPCMKRLEDSRDSIWSCDAWNSPISHFFQLSNDKLQLQPTITMLNKWLEILHDFADN